jgi:hypothetical protein
LQILHTRYRVNAVLIAISGVTFGNYEDRPQRTARLIAAMRLRLGGAAALRDWSMRCAARASHPVPAPGPYARYGDWVAASVRATFAQMFKASRLSEPQHYPNLGTKIFERKAHEEGDIR